MQELLSQVPPHQYYRHVLTSPAPGIAQSRRPSAGKTEINNIYNSGSEEKTQSPAYCCCFFYTNSNLNF